MSVRSYLFTLASLLSLAFLFFTSVAMISAFVITAEGSPYGFPVGGFLALVVQFAVAAVPPTLWIQNRLRKRRALNWVRAGKCHTCGYDVRASTSRCPECGTPISVTNARTDSVFPSLSRVASWASTTDPERTLGYEMTRPSKERSTRRQAAGLALGIFAVAAALLYLGDLALRWCMLNLWK